MTSKQTILSPITVIANIRQNVKQSIYENNVAESRRIERAENAESTESLKNLILWIATKILTDFLAMTSKQTTLPAPTVIAMI